MFEHYIGLDWAQRNMAIARLTPKSKKESVVDVASDIRELKIYLKNLKGSKILAFEESTPAQWLYTELKDCVDELIACDPYRNHLLKEGGKNDKSDALKIAKLLKAEMLKPVFHCTDEYIYLRKLVSGYEDLIKSGVCLKNQRSALFRGRGMDPKLGFLEDKYEVFVLNSLDSRIEHYELERDLYKQELKSLRNKFKAIRNLESIPGIGLIGATTILSTVIDPTRFPNAKTFTSYCGLIKLELMSGGKSYGKRAPRFSRRLKAVYKVAAMACVNAGEKNSMKLFYKYLINTKRYPEHQARHSLARRIAVLSYGVLKTGKPYEVVKHEYLNVKQ